MCNTTTTAINKLPIIAVCKNGGFLGLIKVCFIHIKFSLKLKQLAYFTSPRQVIERWFYFLITLWISIWGLFYCLEKLGIFEKRYILLLVRYSFYEFKVYVKNSIWGKHINLNKTSLQSIRKNKKNNIFFYC